MDLLTRVHFSVYYVIPSRYVEPLAAISNKELYGYHSRF